MLAFVNTILLHRGRRLPHNLSVDQRTAPRAVGVGRTPPDVCVGHTDATLKVNWDSHANCVDQDPQRFCHKSASFRAGLTVFLVALLYR